MFAGYTFKNTNLYELARTHTSYANETKGRHGADNERIEFLGDSVLSVVVSEYLYTHYPQLPEGSLTKIRADVVCEKSLCEIAEKINLGRELLLGKGEEQTGGRTRSSILADAFEAMLGAVYLDSDLTTVKSVLLPLIENRIIKTAENVGEKDYKTTLQEIVQRTPNNFIRYETIKESGPDHQRTYTVEVKINKVNAGIGEGRSKKEAEQMAAKSAIKMLQGEGNATL